ncbi:EF-hand domain-containing protein [Hyphomonas jannaschiana]|uniref:peptidylprolyl isomerase n=1 Tax=Hyphomonas jannaschiana VP2 TaxID=1280952 RepID=A0A059FG46_9PROT|nr:EF-hand domain-containing protein [Hyphomonas jannaschiana]KCZ89594.1 EF hand domain-containing protein [Hyphomonas jannaschiana VP2]
MKRIFLATASFAAVAMIASPAMAGPRGGGPGSGPGMMKDRMVEMMDTDGDGKVSDAEIKAHKAAMFVGIDTNGDGQLSQDELSAHHEVMRAQMQARFEERRGDRVDNMFERYDTNKDGSITRDEVTAVQAARADDWKARKADWAQKGAQMQAERFADMDKDGNGTISQEEFESARMGPGGRGDFGRRGMNGMMPPPPPEDE